MVAKLARWASNNGEKILSINRLNIGRRLTLCFVSIIFAMLAGNAVLLWEFLFAISVQEIVVSGAAIRTPAHISDALRDLTR